MSQMHIIPTWSEENRSLHDAICQARVSSETANELQHLLQCNKQRFADLLDHEPKNASHRSALNSNQAFINRISYNVSKDFVKTTLFLSDQLDINEHTAATLYKRGITEASRVNGNSIDTAVLLYHGERGYLLACLDAILKTAKDASISEEVRIVCYQFMTEIMSERVQIDANTTGTFVSKILATLEKITKLIVNICDTGSAVGQVPVAGSGKLGEDISELRIDRLTDERVCIVQILYHIASLFNIDAEDKLSILKLLEDAELTDPATSYMIVAMISSLSNQNQAEEETPSPATLDFIAAFHNRIMTHGSKVPAIKAVVVLQWILYLSDPVRVQKVTGTEFRDRTDANIKELLDFAIATDVFGFMNYFLLYFQQPNAAIDTERKPIKSPPKTNGTTGVIDKSEYRNVNADIRVEFHTFVIYELEALGVSFIKILFSTLQSLKYKEEDTNIPVQTPLATEGALVSASDSNASCHDLEYFLSFMASVYRERVNAGTIFWNRDLEGLNSFTRWLLDIKVVKTVSAAFDFFGSIATGDICATQMFYIFNNGVDNDLSSSPLFSWGKPFAALEFYTRLLTEDNEESNAIIPHLEEQLLIRFLRILKQTVQYSREARYAFWAENHVRCQTILIDILNSPTSIVLRATLFDVLSAFCSAWGGGVDRIGKAISFQVWRVLDNSDTLVSKRKVEKDKTQITVQPPGLLRELQVERKSHVFTETLSVIKLIGSAIHTQSKREALISGFAPLTSSVPSDLGENTKNPGAEPYISLVVDEIFVNLGSQEYAYAEARWQLAEACLMVMENSVESFSLEDIEHASIRNQLDNELKLSVTRSNTTDALLHYLTHPGFQVIIRILAGGRLINEIFNVIEECAKKENKEVEKMPYHKKCLVRSLRILLAVLNIQSTFCKILLPYIAGFSKKKNSSEFELGPYTFAPLPSVVSLGQLMLFHSKILTRIALLVNYEDQEEICFLSTKILHSLSASRKNEIVTDHSLVKPTSLYNMDSSCTEVLESSNVSEAIIFGFGERLGISLPEATTCDDYEYDINNIPFWLANETLSNTYSYPMDFEPRLSSSVRLAIIDLLLENANYEKPSPTLTEFLLGYNVTNKHDINKLQEKGNNKASIVCIHAILDMLRQGIERPSEHSNNMTEDTADATELLIDTHPILAEKCYKLIYMLCSNHSLSISTMRYLRNREDFFCKQFDAMSARTEENISVESTHFPGFMVCVNGSQVNTDFFRLRSKLHQRAWLLESIALELHTTVAMQQNNETKRMLDLLYGRKNQLSEDDMDTSGQEPSLFSGSARTTFQQPLVKMLELVSSLEFSWKDGLADAMTVKQLDHFKGLDPDLYQTTSDRNCKVYDVPKIFGLLRARQTTISNEANNNGIETEMGSILAWLMTENHKREIAHAKLHCLNAWKQVVQITLIECFDLLDFETRENTVFELLTMLLPKIIHTTDYEGEMLNVMSEVVLTLVDRLNKDKSIRPASQLPMEKLCVIFDGILECVKRKDSDIFVRGKMYSAITSFILYISGHGRDEHFIRLEQFIMKSITLHDSRLLDTLCSDAVDSSDVWKTPAFSALDSLNTLALKAGSHVVQRHLVKKNVLQYVIDMIRSDDAALAGLLEEADAPLLPLYIFEAKMSTLLGLAMNPEGADLLLGHRIFEVLSQCQFMKAQQQDLTTIQVNIGDSAELTERHQRLVMPTLKLIVAINFCYGGKNDIILLKAETWARSQLPALLNILKYETLPKTLVTLEQLKLVTAILCIISGRNAYSTDIIKRGINQLHNAMIQLNIPDNLSSTIMPITEQEKNWDLTIDSATNKSTFKTKADKIISLIKNSIDEYKLRK